MPNRHPAHAPIDGPKLDVQIVQAPERFMFNATMQMNLRRRVPKCLHGSRHVRNPRTQKEHFRTLACVGNGHRCLVCPVATSCMSRHLVDAENMGKNDDNERAFILFSSQLQIRMLWCWPALKPCLNFSASRIHTNAPAVLYPNVSKCKIHLTPLNTLKNDQEP